MPLAAKPISQTRLQREEDKTQRLPSDIDSPDISDVDVNAKGRLVRAQTSVVTPSHATFSYPPL